MILLIWRSVEQHAEAKAIDAAVVGDDGEVAGAFALDFGDQVFRNAAQTEAAGETVMPSSSPARASS